LPANLHYDVWRGDFDLVDPARNPLDEKLSALCRAFAKGDMADRLRVRDSASVDDFYTLLAFARRSGVTAMRDRRPEHIVDGFTAIAMIERSRIDFRDALMALSLLNHAGGVVDANPEGLLADAAALAEPTMSELILGFRRQSQDYKDIRKSWGYTVIETEAGPGFIGWGFRSYEPTYPLDQIALTLAGLAKRDKYGSATITLASDLPAVWLSNVDNKALRCALTSVRAVATVRADLRPQESSDYKSQFLVIFLAELNDETSAQSLLRLAEEKETQPNSFAMVGVNLGRLFCLVIGRSFTAGKAAFEDQSSIRRFSAPIAEAVKSLT
jgi:hypothetical protein